jgi:hexosaminidase
MDFVIINDIGVKTQDFLKRRSIYIAFLFLGSAFVSCASTPDPSTIPQIATHGIIPLPQNIDLPEGSVVLNRDFVFVTGSVFAIANQAAQNIFTNTLNAFQTSSSSNSGKVSFQFVQDNSLTPESYSILINANGIVLKAADDAGAYYAVQSLKQYLWSITNGLKQATLTVRFLTVSDAPRYSWRAFHLDVSRHMFTKAYLEKIIDWLAYYKYNKFHIHFTDDQGWRIESKTYPLLNSVGSWRTYDKYDSVIVNSTGIDPRFIKTENGKTLYGGFYSQADIAEIVTYANNRFIEIVPEIDMPGHMQAAIKAYPFLSCSSGVATNSEFSVPICPCKQDVYDFAYQVWDEILPLFPSKFVHIGADEVNRDTWAASTDCQNYMTANHLSSTAEIQSFFVKNLESHLENEGKTVMVWDDVTDTKKFDSKLKVMYWRDWMTDAPNIAAANGNQIVFTRWDLFYLNSDNSIKNLEDLLLFDVSKTYSQAVNSKIMGFQGCVWTEWIGNEKTFESLVFPRIQALAEVNWSTVKNIYSFNTRLVPHKKYLKSVGVNWVDPK